VPPSLPKGSDLTLAWFAANLINIVLILVVCGVVGLILRGMIRDRKAGKSACGGSCADCGACHGCGTCRQ